jgi:hypothetical protein
MTDDEKENPDPQRDGRGRYVKGVSGNPAGKPAGIMNEATRVAAMILTGSTPVLVHKAIELALMGKTAPLNTASTASSRRSGISRSSPRPRRRAMAGGILPAQWR